MSKDRKYCVYKLLSSGDLSPMGNYVGRDTDHALQRMAKSGNLCGTDWDSKYLVIPQSSKSVAKRIPMTQVHSKIVKNFISLS